MPRADWIPVAAAFYDMLARFVDTGEIVRVQLRTAYQMEGTLEFEDAARMLFTCVAERGIRTGEHVRITFSSADVIMVLHRTPKT